MDNLIYSLILSLKYISVAALMFIVPSETVMPIVGYAAALGHIWLPGAIIAGVLGTTLWSVMIYAIARSVGLRRLNSLIRRYGKLLGIQKRSVDKAGKWFDRNAGVTVFVGKFVPGLRTVVCIPAGLRRMPFGAFLGYSLLGSSLDALLLAYLGYMARAYFHELQTILDNASNVTVLCLLLLIVGWWVWRRRK